MAPINRISTKRKIRCSQKIATSDISAIFISTTIPRISNNTAKLEYISVRKMARPDITANHNQGSSISVGC